MIAPLRFHRSELLLIQFCCQGIARLKPGATVADADADAARMLPMAEAKFPMNPAFSHTAFRDMRIAPRSSRSKMSRWAPSAAPCGY